MLKVINVVGARPNFMKVAPIVEAMRRRAADFAPVVLHTGQHYDERMSDAFFRDLGLPRPDVHLGVGSGSHAQQTAAVCRACESEPTPRWTSGRGSPRSRKKASLIRSS